MISSVTLMAQEDEIKLQKVKADKVPAAVVTAVEEDYPGVSITEYTIVPAPVYQEEWEVTETKNELSDNAEIDRYMIDVYGKSGRIMAVYDADGNLLKVKGVIKDTELPKSIVDFIYAEYSGYEILMDKEVLKTTQDGIIDHYKVKIKKDKYVKILWFNEKGELLKEIVH